MSSLYANLEPVELIHHRFGTHLLQIYRVLPGMIIRDLSRSHKTPWMCERHFLFCENFLFCEIQGPQNSSGHDQKALAVVSKCLMGPSPQIPLPMGFSFHGDSGNSSPEDAQVQPVNISSSSLEHIMEDAGQVHPEA